MSTHSSFEPISELLPRAVRSYRESQINGFVDPDLRRNSLVSLGAAEGMAECALVILTLPRGTGRTWSIANAIRTVVPNSLVVAPIPRQAELVQTYLKQQCDDASEPQFGVYRDDIHTALTKEYNRNFDAVFVDEWQGLSLCKKIALLERFYPAAKRDRQFGIFAISTGL